MLSLIFANCLAQSKNLNPGPDMDMPLDTAVQKWSGFVSRGASPDYATALGKTRDELRALRNRIGRRMVHKDLDHLQGTSVDFLGQKIKKALDAELADLNLNTESALYKFCLAEAVVNWVRSHLLYNDMLVPGKIAEANQWSVAEESKFRSTYWTPKTLLERPELSAVCAGYSRLTFYICRSIGVPMLNAVGYTRGALQVNGTNTSNPPNHSWNILVLKADSGGTLRLQTDPTQARVLLSEARSSNFQWQSEYCFPDTTTGVAFYHYAQFITKIDEQQEKLAEAQTLGMSEQQWRQMGSIRVFDRMRGSILQVTKNATINRMPR